MLTFYLLLAIVYVLLLMVLGKTWIHQKIPFPDNIENETITILIPLRNESQNLSALFDHITRQSYRPLEVIFIDDNSEDDSRLILDRLIDSQKEKGIIFHLLDSNGNGKKAALSTGIEKANGNLILTSDADCAVSENWVEEMVKSFADQKIQIVAGPVMPTKGDGFFYDFQQIEWASILLATQAGFYYNAPIMCSAANMAYRKSTFLNVEGYNGNENQLSGDDEFLLKKVVKTFGPESVVYLKEPQNLVYTHPQESWKKLFSQRIRWASKWKSHGISAHVAASLAPVLVQIFFLSSFWLLAAGWKGPIVFVLIWSLKFFFEYKYLGVVLKTFQIRHHFWTYLGTSLIHPFYVLVCVFGALFINFEWKGRNSVSKA